MMVLIAVISLSCGIKQALSRGESLKSRKIFTESLSNNGDYFAKDPMPSETDRKNDTHESDGGPSAEPGNEIPEEDNSKPFAVKPNGDFSYTDHNGVNITKKDGMQITKFSETEIYYLPDVI